MKFNMSFKLLVCWSSCRFCLFVCFCLHNWYSRQRTLLTWFYEIYGEHRIVSGHLWIDLFQTRYDAKHYLTLQFDSRFNDIDVHWRPHGYGKDRTCAVILFYSCLKLGGIGPRREAMWWAGIGDLLPPWSSGEVCQDCSHRVCLLRCSKRVSSLAVGAGIWT